MTQIYEAQEYDEKRQFRLFEESSGAELTTYRGKDGSLGFRALAMASDTQDEITSRRARA